MSVPIPILEAEHLARVYGYDQVIVFAADRKASRNHVTTFGKTEVLCKEVAQAGEVVAGMFGPQGLDYLREQRSRLDAEIRRQEQAGA